eukprot:GHVT01076366.1.p1 GENE.GHVT01076366.1~~GHVT01076366.1.p1  ORF type:complete len:109 (+),score=1.87 GHVT01076366.1:248-574(+)
MASNHKLALDISRGNFPAIKEATERQERTTRRPKNIFPRVLTVRSWNTSTVVFGDRLRLQSGPIPTLTLADLSAQLRPGSARKQLDRLKLGLLSPGIPQQAPSASLTD